MNKVFEKDIYRYYGKYNLTLKERIKMSPDLCFIKYFRKINCKNSRFCLNYFLFKFYQKKYHIQIPKKTKIGDGLFLGHYGRIIINPNVIIGKNCNIATGVTIGQENRGKRKGTPVIGDEVWIGTNAVIVGNIKIGNNVLIAPNSFVNCNIPDNSIVVGNPIKIIPNIDATKDYINNKI